MIFNRKGQSAVEYLMNYAWAIALIIIVGIAIFGLDVGGIRTSIVGQGSTVVSSAEEVSVRDHKYDTDGNLTLVLRNNGASVVNMSLFNVTEKDGATITGASNSDSENVGPGEVSSTKTINVEDSATVGRAYEITIEITYKDSDTDVTNKIRHELKGSVQTA